MLAGGPFIGIWVGEEFREKGEIVIWMIVGYMAFPFINPFSSRYLTAVNRHAIFVRYAPLSALMNIVMSLALVKPFGIAGVAAASMITALVFVPLYLRYTCKVLTVPVREYLARCILPCLLPTLALVLVIGAGRSIYSIQSYADIMLVLGLAGPIWLVLFWYVALDSGERGYILDKLGRKSTAA